MKLNFNRADFYFKQGDDLFIVEYNLYSVMGVSITWDVCVYKNGNKVFTSTTLRFPAKADAINFIEQSKNDNHVSCT